MKAAAARELPSGDVAFVISDVEGSTPLLKELGQERYADVLAEVLELQRSEVEAAGGVLVGVEGDGCLFAFATADAALDACAKAQARLEARPGHPVRVRMGCHVGRDVRPVGTTYTSLAIHEAARVAAAARGGQVLVTGAVDEVAPGRCTALGLFHVRDFDAPIALYALPSTTSARALSAPRATRTGVRSFPSYRTSFVDRVLDRARVTAALEASRLVTLVGPGGTGKTRLAVEALREDPTFAAAWFVDLTKLPASADVQAVLETVRAALGDVLQHAAGGDPIKALDAILLDQSGLLILDNCEHVLDAAGDCADLLLDGCAQLRLLCTSREPLGLPDEVLVRLDGLDLPPDASLEAVRTSDACRLFLDRAQQVSSLPLTPELAGSVAGLATRLDGMPLALELVAAMTWESSVEELESRVEAFLTDAGSARPGRGRPSRHVSLRAVIDWSVAGLDASGRQALAALALAAPPVGTRTKRAALAPLELPDAEAVVADLVRRSLIELEATGTVRLLETIRGYGKGLPDLGDLRQDVLEALARDCIDAGAASDELRPVPHPEAREVLPTAVALLEESQLSESLRQQVVWAVFPLLWQSGPSRSTEVLDRVLALGGDDRATRARLHALRAVEAQSADDTAAADHHLRQSELLMAGLADVTLRAQYDNARCSVLCFRDEVEEALHIAQGYLRDEADPPSAWLALLAQCYFLRHDPRATEVLEEMIARGTDHEQMLNSANQLALRGEGEAALRRVLAYLEGASGPMSVAMSMDVIGVALAADGYTVECFALCLFSDRALAERGYVPFQGELPIIERQRQRARRELTATEVAEAQQLADQLDLASARELGVRLAQERLQRAATADREAAAD